MKKLLSMILVLVFALCAFATAETYTVDSSETYDVTLTAPEGYIFTKSEYLGDDCLAGLFEPADENVTVYYTLIVAYSDEYAALYGEDKTLNDLTEEEFAAAVQDLCADFYAPTTSVVTTSFGTKCIVVNEDGCESEFATILTVYHGYFIQVYIDSLDGVVIDDAIIQTAVDILSSMEIVNK